MKAPLFIGIDGGGTKCKARLEDAAGNLLATSVAGPANPARDFSQTLHSIEQAVMAALIQAGLSSDDMHRIHAGIGLAGVNLPVYRDKMLQWQHPFASMHLTTDLHIAALGAHNGENGAIVIVGTGSSGVYLHDHLQLEMGGHGFGLGDKGSGAWLGNQAVRHCLESLDGLTAHTLLTEAVLAHSGSRNSAELVQRYLTARPAEFASLAPQVFACAEQDDPIAHAIILDGADYLSRLAAKLREQGAPRLSFIGGLAHKITPYLQTTVQQFIQPAQFAPEYGAILFCREDVNE